MSSNNHEILSKQLAWAERRKQTQLPPIERVNPDIPDKGIYSLNGYEGLYQFQQDRYETDQILPEHLDAYREAHKKFLDSPEGKLFQTYKIRKIRRLHGLNVWSVDEEGIQGGGLAGHIDFTMGGHFFRYPFIPEEDIWVSVSLKNPWPTVWHEFTERREMKKGLTYLESHTIANKIEIILRAGRDVILPVGTYRSPAPHYCGPAVLKTYLRFLGEDAPIEELNYLCQNTYKDGTDPAKMIEAMAAFGLRGIDLQGMTVEQVKKFIHAGYPIVVNWQDTPGFGEGHYSILIGYSEEKGEFIFSDTSEDEGYMHMKIDQFMQQWYELEDNTVQEGIVFIAK